jgi:hypothetical protein
MLCLACGAPMSLVQVVKDTTMFVPGYEHHTWQCSGCSTVEQRMTFTREETATQTVPAEPAQAILAEQTETALVAVEPTKPTSTQAVSSELTHPEPPAAMPKMNARARALDEKLRDLKERVNAARKAAGETARPAQFNRDQDDKSPSVSSEGSSGVKPDEPWRPPTEPIASPAPISHYDPIAPTSNVPTATKFRERLAQLMSAMRRRELSKVR